MAFPINPSLKELLKRKVGDKVYGIRSQENLVWFFFFLCLFCIYMKNEDCIYIYF